MATIALGLRLVLAAVFLAAAVGKLLDLPGSRRAMEDFGVPARLARPAGTALPLAELIAAVALVFRPTARWGAALALLLLLVFIVGISRALAKGQEPDCHCFGQIHSAPAGPVTLARNAVLAVFALVIVVYGPGPAIDTWISQRSTGDLVAAAAVICALAAVAYAISLRAAMHTLTRDLDTAREQAVRARAGLPVGVPAPGFSLPNLEGGELSLDGLVARGQPVLLIFVTPWCGPCHSLLPNVRQWQETLSETMTIVPVSSGTAEQNELLAEQGLENVVLQESMEVAEIYGVKGTPSGVFVGPDGKIASTVAESDSAIEPLVRVAVRGGVQVKAQAPV